MEIKGWDMDGVRGGVGEVECGRQSESCGAGGEDCEILEVRVEGFDGDG